MVRLQLVYTFLVSRLVTVIKLDPIKMKRAIWNVFLMMHFEVKQTYWTSKLRYQQLNNVLNSNSGLPLRLYLHSIIQIQYWPCFVSLPIAGEKFDVMYFLECRYYPYNKENWDFSIFRLVIQTTWKWKKVHYSYTIFDCECISGAWFVLSYKFIFLWEGGYEFSVSKSM